MSDPASYIATWVRIFTEYARSCAENGWHPLTITVRRAAWILREYRRAHKFWDCV